MLHMAQAVEREKRPGTYVIKDPETLAKHMAFVRWLVDNGRIGGGDRTLYNNVPTDIAQLEVFVKRVIEGETSKDLIKIVRRSVDKVRQKGKQKNPSNADSFVEDTNTFVDVDKDGTYQARTVLKLFPEPTRGVILEATSQTSRSNTSLGPITESLRIELLTEDSITISVRVPTGRKQRDGQPAFILVSFWQFLPYSQCIYSSEQEEIVAKACKVLRAYVQAK